MKQKLTVSKNPSVFFISRGKIADIVKIQEKILNCLRQLKNIKKFLKLHKIGSKKFRDQEAFEFLEI